MAALNFFVLVALLTVGTISNAIPQPFGITFVLKRNYMESIDYVIKYNAITGAGKADEACTSIGGTCQDWRNSKCTAGYETGLCSGDTNIRCCKPCDQTCKQTNAITSLI